MKNTDTATQEMQQAEHQLRAFLQKHWQLFLFEGIAFLLMGIAAIVIPQFSSIVAVIFLGWLIVMAGVIHTGRALFFSDMPGFGLWLALGLLQIVVGLLLIADPIAGVITLTLMMALFFALEGVLKTYLAFMMRPLPQWHFVFFNGMTALLFAAIILVFWHETAHWLLGLLVGVNMAMLGWSLITLCLEHKTEEP